MLNTPGFVIPLIGLAVALVFMRIASLERRINRLSRVEAKLDALLKQQGVRFDEFQDVPPGVREAIEQGERILAIKRFREARGVDLKEAKEFVDEIRRWRVSAS